jgi:glycolate oxidase
LPRPTHKIATLSFFKDVSAAINVVSEIMTSGKLIPTTIELMDHFCFSRTAEFLKQDYPVNEYGAVLLFEVDGNDPETVNADASIIRQVCADNFILAEYTADTEEEIERFWKIRKQIPWILKRASSHVSFEDIVVPIANIPALLAQLDRIGSEYDTHIPVFGHAGDGNIHASPLKNPDHSVEQWEDMLPKLLRDTYLATAELGGTISGEHGIGHKRKGYMELVMSEAHLDILRNIKRALDPNLILNPGKIFDM